MVFASSIPSRSATSFASWGWLLPVRSLIELVDIPEEEGTNVSKIRRDRTQKIMTEVDMAVRSVLWGRRKSFGGVIT
jgi:hypothetical protein